ncbi:MAG TPA: PQQ-binding-like beta-propeller repeat protein, partial [Vicinamibacterales bacterium]|nr:PQQ-binding-like beta-propeller repeat protein [Vicinamibacterales bacterium]
MSQRRPAIWIVTALAATIVLSFISLQQTSADISGFIPTWRMIGHDSANTRSQPFEARISRRNVDRLSPRWTFTTAGDVSATPAVVNEADKERGRGRRRLVAYFPDWGGMLWKLDAETGKVLWSHTIAEYNGIADSLSRTSPAVTNGLVLVADLNGNMMGVDAETGVLRWLT